MLSPVVFVAVLAGLLPSLLWLTFWLLEDKLHPEPKRYIFFCFIAGMALVAPITIGGQLFGIVLPLERYTLQHLSGFNLLLSWAIIEELTKFGAAYFIALRARVFDEPLDAVIYMVTVALGFSAAENALFLMNPLTHGNILQTVVTGDLRFIGATLLHTLASATIGLCLAYAFNRSFRTKVGAAIGGVILAIALHALFNQLILHAGSAATFWIFLTIWLGIIAVLLNVERIKRPVPHYS
jgi:RsiW-degrading membrane proteinase PrsW (M82 family)